MQNSNQAVVPAGSIGGVVRSFVELKAFGFIDGDDGNNYFVHLIDILSTRKAGIPNSTS